MRPTPRVSIASTLVWCVALAALIASIGLLGAACSTDSPTEPRQTPGPGAGGPGGSDGAFNITVTVNPSQLTAGSDTPAQVTIRVRRADNGQAPADGTTMVVTASLGNFGDVNGDGLPDSSVVVALFGGQAVLNYFPPETATGTAVIQAQLQGSVGQAVVQIAGIETFFVSSVQPSVGSPQGGDTVNILGGGFEEPVRVLFAGKAAQVLSVTPTRIRVVTPPADDRNVQTTVDVLVTVNLNEPEQASDLLPGGFTYTPGGGPGGAVPAVFSLTPASGPNEGGTQVVIRGEGFQAPVQVIFGDGITCAAPAPGVEATLQSVSPTEIVVITPAATGFGFDNRNQAVNVVVKNLDSGLCTTATQAFRYGVQIQIFSIGPNQGPVEGGTIVTIFGQGFDEPVAVTLAGIAAQVISVTGTEIVVRSVGVDVSTCADVVGPVRVTNIENGDTAVGPDFRYRVPAPTITGISPSSGGEGGNTLVTVNGTGFEPPVRVLFGDQAGSVESASSTAISVRTPAFTGAFPQQQCTGAGGVTGTRNGPASVGVTVINLATGCEDELPNGFVYNPSDASCRVEPTEVEPQCSDGIDNDGDGLTDFNGGVSPPGDPDCLSDGDDDESM